VVNNTDTFFLDGSTTANINIGDQVMFLNENNGYNYTATNAYALDGNDEAVLTADGNVSFSAGPNSIHNELIKLVKVYPNPAKGFVQVSNSSSLSINEVGILSLTGQEIIRVPMNGNEATISTEELSNGIYFLRFTNQSKVIGVQKINILH
jgi:hypothetical protein